MGIVQLALFDCKRCSKCHKVLPHFWFNNDRTASDGLKCRCRVCSSRNPELILRKLYAESLPIGMALCTKCLNVKPHEDFSPSYFTDTDHKSGTCRTCYLERGQLYFDLNAEMIRQRKRENYWQNCNEIREAQRERRRTDPEYRAKMQACDAERYPREAERRRAATKRWTKDNREKYRIYMQRAHHVRRFRERQSPNTWSNAEWLYLLKLCKHCCLCCGTSDNLSRDHIIPIAKGGTNDIRNMQVLCRSCNASKHTKVIDYRSSTIKEALDQWLTERQKEL